MTWLREARGANELIYAVRHDSRPVPVPALRRVPYRVALAPGEPDVVIEDPLVRQVALYAGDGVHRLGEVVVAGGGGDDEAVGGVGRQVCEASGRQAERREGVVADGERASRLQAERRDRRPAHGERSTARLVGRRVHVRELRRLARTANDTAHTQGHT